MRRALIAGLISGGLLATGLPAAAAEDAHQVAAETRYQKIQRCIKQANRELKGTGRVIKRSQFDKIILGTSGDDMLVDHTPGRDLICGFGGNDRTHNNPGVDLGKGDVFVGGPGDDDAYRLQGGIYLGGGGNDRLWTLHWGLFVGGYGDDYYGHQEGGRFYGRSGADHLDGTMDGGSFIGGAGDDRITQVDGTSLLRGGPGDDWINELNAGTFVGGPGDDEVWNVRGTFVGGEGRNIARYVYSEGVFKGGPARDRIKTLYGKFAGAGGWDTVELLKGGRYYGGPGTDRLGTCDSGIAVNVERGDVPCNKP